MKTYDIEVQRLKSMKHDRGLVEIGLDALVLARPVRDDAGSASCLRLHELSRFERLAGIWLYVDGQLR